MASISTLHPEYVRVNGRPVDQDVIAVVKDDRGAAIQMLYIRSGKLIGQRQYMLDGASEASPSEAVQEFVKQYYSDAPEVPREILLPVDGIVAEKFEANAPSRAVDIDKVGDNDMILDIGPRSV